MKLFINSYLAVFAFLNLFGLNTSAQTASCTVNVLDEWTCQTLNCTQPMTPIVYCLADCIDLENEEGIELQDLDSAYGSSTTILSQECFRYMPLPGFIGSDSITATYTNATADTFERKFNLWVFAECPENGLNEDCFEEATFNYEFNNFIAGNVHETYVTADVCYTDVSFPIMMDSLDYSSVLFLGVNESYETNCINVFLRNQGVNIVFDDNLCYAAVKYRYKNK